MTPTSDELALSLKGDRAGILGLLASLLPKCQPLMRFDHWTSPKGELASAGAAPGASGTAGCLSCPAAACVQGTVVDQSGASLPGAHVRVELRSGSGSARTAETDDAGAFLVTGLAAGPYVVSVETTGFAKIVSQPAFTVTPSTTYLFDAPFELRVATSQESITVSRQPIACRKGRPPARH